MVSCLQFKKRATSKSGLGSSPTTNLWLLVPPAYALKKHIGTDRPLYAYSSTELKALAKDLHELSTDLQNLRHVLQGDTPPETGS
jgi:hypothetical protein